MVWTAPREVVSLRELIAGDPALLVFYLFDWSPRRIGLQALRI